MKRPNSKYNYRCCKEMKISWMSIHSNIVKEYRELRQIKCISDSCCYQEQTTWQHITDNIWNKLEENMTLESCWIECLSACLTWMADVCCVNNPCKYCTPWHWTECSIKGRIIRIIFIVYISHFGWANQGYRQHCNTNWPSTN